MQLKGMDNVFGNEEYEDNSNEESDVKDFKFPITTKEELDLLEDKLIDKNFENCLVKKFSRICGTSGSLKLSKIGLMVMKHIISDELLHQLTWKGIRGCEKTPFKQYIKMRQFLFNVIKLADRSCTAIEVDTFVKNSAIKHSGQRLKRISGSGKSAIDGNRKNKTSTTVMLTKKSN